MIFLRGYIAVYKGNDFCELEKFPIKIENMPDKAAYIWEVVTKKEFMGRGIAKKLLKYVLDKFKDYTLYSCINSNNIPSIALHEKYGFKKLCEFEQNNDNEVKKQIIFINKL